MAIEKIKILGAYKTRYARSQGDQQVVTAANELVLFDE